MPTALERLAVVPALFAVSLLAGALEASEVVVSPVRLQLNYGSNTTTVSVTGKSPSRILFQLESFAWTQDRDADRLAPTKDILAMPPVFTIEPGRTQIVRIMFRGSRSDTQELTYRILLTEVPVAGQKTAGQIRTYLQVSVPVFVKPKVPSRPQLQWSLQNVDKKGLRLLVRNSGTSHVLLGTLKLFSGKERAQPIHESPISGYVLPGQTRSWMLDVTRAAANSEIFLRADTDDGKKEMSLIVQ